MKRLLKLIIFISERPRSDEQLKLEKQDVTNNCNSESAEHGVKKRKNKRWKKKGETVKNKSDEENGTLFVRWSRNV